MSKIIEGAPMPTPPIVTDADRKMAESIVFEYNDADAEFMAHLKRNTKEHCGDCTNVPMSCSMCFIERIEAGISKWAECIAAYRQQVVRETLDIFMAHRFCAGGYCKCGLELHGGATRQILGWQSHIRALGDVK